MKKSIRLLTFLLILTIAITLVGCSTFNKVDKALTEIGYEKIESNDDAKDTKKDAEESEYSITVHVYSNKNNVSVAEILKVNTVMVLEFKVNKDMK